MAYGANDGGKTVIRTFSEYNVLGQSVMILLMDQGYQDYLRMFLDNE